MDRGIVYLLECCMGAPILSTKAADRVQDLIGEYKLDALKTALEEVNHPPQLLDIVQNTHACGDEDRLIEERFHALLLDKRLAGQLSLIEAVAYLVILAPHLWQTPRELLCNFIKQKMEAIGSTSPELAVILLAARYNEALQLAIAPQAGRLAETLRSAER